MIQSPAGDAGGVRVNQKSISFTGTGDQTIFTADAATAKTDLCDIAFFISGAGTAILKDQATTVYGTYTAPAGGLWVNRPALGADGVRFTFAGNLILNMSTSLTVTGDLCVTPRSAS